MALDLGIEEEPMFGGTTSSYTKVKYHVSIVIPAYNEEERIKPFLSSLISILEDDIEIIVVVDGNDTTPGIVKSFGERVRLIEFPNRIGKGRAIIEGFKRAEGEVIGFVDADGAISAEEILRLSNLVTKEIPVVIGSRWMKNSRILIAEPTLNRFASRMFHYLTFLILGLREKDTQCGIKFFHKSVIDLIINKIEISDWMIDVALLYHARLIGKEIREVGIVWSHKENSKFRILKGFPIMFFELIGLKIVHSKRLGGRFQTLSNIAADFRESS